MSDSTSNQWRTFVAQPQLYLELNSTHFFIALLHHHKGTTSVTEHTEIELESWVVGDDSVYGLKVLHDHLAHFLTTHNLARPWTIVSVTGGASMDDTKQPFLLLQICLSFCSAGIRIIGMYDTPLLEKELIMKSSRGVVTLEGTARTNLFRLFLPHQSDSLTTWLITTFVTLGVATLLMLAVTRSTGNDIAYLSDQQQNNFKLTEDAKDQAHALHCLENTNEELNHRLQTIKDLETVDVPNLPAVVRSLTINVSKRTWVSQVRMSAVQQPSGSGQSVNGGGHAVSITGHTPAHDEVTTLVRRLTQTTVMMNVNLEQLQQVQQATPQGMRQEYTFNVSASLPNPVVT